MNLQSLIVVVLRLIALNFLLEVALQLTSFVPQLFRLSREDTSWTGFAWLLLGVIIMVGAAAALWFLAMPIARLVTRDVSRDLSFGTLSLVDCYSVAFVGVGLFYIVGHLPQVLNWSHYFFMSAAAKSVDSLREEPIGYGVSRAFVPLIVGIIMLLKGPRWAVALARQTSSPVEVQSVNHDDGATEANDQ